MWIEKVSIIRKLILYNLIYRFSEISIKISASYFAGIDKLFPEFTWRQAKDPE